MKEDAQNSAVDRPIEVTNKFMAKMKTFIEVKLEDTEQPRKGKRCDVSNTQRKASKKKRVRLADKNQVLC